MNLNIGKHQFLKREPSCKLNSNVIDRIISRGLGQGIRNEIAMSPFLTMINFESEIFCPDVDVTKAHLAFGRLAIPKLKREVLRKDILTAKRALNALLDYVHDPERAVEAIRLQVVPRLVRLMMSEDPFIRQHVIMILGVLALQPGGKMAIVSNKTIMSNLSQLLIDSDRDVRFSTAKTVQALTTWHFGIEELIEDYYVYLIINQINNELDNDILEALMNTLLYMLDHSMEAKKQAIDHKALEFSVFLDHPVTQIRKLGTQILAQISRHPLGKDAILEYKQDLLSKFTCLLKDKDSEVRTYAAEALMFNLVTKEAKAHCLFKLPTVCALMENAQFFRSPGLQVNCIKGLTCIAEHPQARAYLKSKIKEIKTIRPADSLVKSHKETLITVINTVI